MPVAAVGAAATVGVGYLQHRSANNAAKKQKEATDAALAHETSRESTTDKRYQMAWDDYQQRHKAWEARNFGGAAAAGGGGGKVGGGNAFTQTAALAPGQLQMAGQDPTAAYGATAGQGTAKTVLGEQSAMAQQGVEAPWQDWKQYLGGMGNASA